MHVQKNYITIVDATMYARGVALRFFNYLRVPRTSIGLGKARGCQSEHFSQNISKVPYKKDQFD